MKDKQTNKRQERALKLRIKSYELNVVCHLSLCCFFFVWNILLLLTLEITILACHQQKQTTSVQTIK